MSKDLLSFPSGTSIFAGLVDSISSGLRAPVLNSEFLLEGGD